MPTHIKTPSIIKSEGNKPKTIEEFIGHVNSRTKQVSVARMKSSSGWMEPGQKPEFDEYTLVVQGTLKVECKEGIVNVQKGECIIVHRGEWVRYSTPGPTGAEYISVCIPAFSPETMHRDE